MKRREDPRLLTGHGQYVDDIVLPGHAALHVRAQRRGARAASCASTSRPPRALDGVTAVLTATDLNPHAGSMQPTMMLTTPGAPLRPLADGDVRFVGEPIVLIVAGSRYLAEDAAELVEVEIESEPAVIDVEHALDDGVPVVHPELGTNLGAEMEFPVAPELAGAAFEETNVVRRTFRQQRHTPGPDGDAGDRRLVRAGRRRAARVDEHARTRTRRSRRSRA